MTIAFTKLNPRFLLSVRLFDAALVAVAVCMVALVLVPARIWHHPANDAVYHGFDPNFVYVNPRGDGSTDGTIAMSSRSLTLTSPPGSQPVVDLVTSPLSFGASMDLSVLAPATNAGSLSLGLWTPETGTAYYLLFGLSPGNPVSTEVITGGTASKTLVGGKIVDITPLGTYIQGHVYHVAMNLNKKAGTITTTIAEVGAASVSNETPLSSQTVVSEAQFPELFKGLTPTLSLTLTSGGAVASATVANYSLTLPSQPDSVAELVEKVDDGRARLLVIVLAILGASLAGLAVGRRAMPATGASIGDIVRREWTKASTLLRPWPLAFLAVAAIGYLLLNSSLFLFGSPHYDVYASKIWSYLAAHNGLVDLYHQTFLIPAAAVEGGIPLHDAAFPYGPTKAYFYLFIGWLYRLTLAPAGVATADTYQLEFLLKSVNVAFGLVDSLLIFLILGRAGAKLSSARLAAALFALNPALMFIMSVWGSTETISLFFVLLSIWLAQRRLATLAWITLALGSFTRPQMLVLAFLLGCAYLRRFPISTNVRAISWSVVVFFLVVSPFSVAVGPSLPVDYVSHIVGFQVGARAADPTTLAISPALYSVWTLPLLYISGQHGLERMWYPRSADLFASITYGQASSLLTIGLLIAVGLILLIRRSDTSLRRQLPLVAFGMFGWLMVGDSLISRYLLYGLVLVILCAPSLTNPLYLWSVVWLSFVVLVTSWSQLAMDVAGSVPINAQNSAITRAVLSLFANDRFITFGTVANLAVLLSIGIAAAKAPKHVPVEEPRVISRPLQLEFPGMSESLLNRLANHSIRRLVRHVRTSRSRRWVSRSSRTPDRTTSGGSKSVQMDSVEDRLINLVWTLGVRTFRLTRRAHLSTMVEPAFAKLAGILPTSKEDIQATLPTGARLRMPPGYRDTRTVVTGLFQSDETRLLQRLTRPGMTFLDVGAYVGYFTILASSWVGPEGHVFAFEPDSLAYEYLVKNIEANECSNVVAINKAVADRETTANLVRDPKGPESFLTNRPATGGSAVETTTLDSIFKAANWPTVGVIKINIEGSEPLALQGMKELSRRNPDLQLVMEFNPTAMARVGVSREYLTTLLNELGFRRGQIVERNLATTLSGELLPREPAVYNILLTK
jgi:FkbM family methyltransferase